MRVGHRRMCAEEISDLPLAAVERTSQRIRDAQVRRAALDAPRWLRRILDLRERARERERIAGELRAHRVGEKFALAAHAHREQPRDEWSENPADDPHHEENDDEWVGAATAVAIAAAPSAPAAESAVEHHASRAVRDECHRAHERREQRHEAHVEILDVTHLVSDHRLQLVARTDRDQSLRDRDVGIALIVSCREGVRIRIVDDPDMGLRDSGGDRHLLDHVHELLLLRRLRVDDLACTGGLEHVRRPGAVRILRHRRAQRGEHDAEPGKEMVIRARRTVRRREIG